MCWKQSSPEIATEYWCCSGTSDLLVIFALLESDLMLFGSELLCLFWKFAQNMQIFWIVIENRFCYVQLLLIYLYGDIILKFIPW